MLSTSHPAPPPIDADRVNDLDHLLKELCPRIVEYVASATPSDPRHNLRSLGTYHEPATLKDLFKVESTGQSLDQILRIIDKVLSYSVNTWSPGFMDKLYASNTPIGVASDLVLLILNTNSHVYTVLPVLLVLENNVGREYARMFFGSDNAECGGLTFPGGSYSNLTSMHMARALRFPDTKNQGNGSHRFAVYTSAHCHYLVTKAAILMGLGSDHVFKVPVDSTGAMDVGALRSVIQSSKDSGFTPFYVNATAGTTVYGLYDPIRNISSVAKDFNCHLHIDGLWGGNVVFSQRYGPLRLDGCELADSITVNPHKMLGVPNTCSFLLVPRVHEFQKAMSLHAPYLFHGRDEDLLLENFDLADGTMGCGRRADAFKLYLAWQYYGTLGFAKRLDHAYSIAEYFIQRLFQDSRFTVCQTIGGESAAQFEPACLQVCFYYRPDSYISECHTDITRFISRKLHSNGRFLVDFSPPPGTDSFLAPGEFFRVVFNSPVICGTTIDQLIECIIEAGAEWKQ